MKKRYLGSLMALALVGSVAACSSDSKSNDDNADGGGGGGGATGGSGTGGNTAGSGGNKGGNTAGSGGGGTAGATGGTAGGAGGAAGGAAGNAGGMAGQAASYKVASEFTCPAGMTFGDPLPPEAMRKLTLVKDGLKGGEGGIWVESQKALFFSDLQRAGADGLPAAQLGPYWRMASNSKIWKHTPADGMTVEWLPAAGANGMALSADGMKLLVAHIADRSITAVSLADKAKTKVVDKYMNATFKVTNDLAVRSDGHIYFSDPMWQAHILGESDCAVPAGATKVYHANAAGTVTVVADNLVNPNGVAMSADGKTLYVSSLTTSDAGCGGGIGKVTKFPINDDGSTGTGTALITEGINWPDGLTVDCAGNIYVASNGVQVFKSDGTKIGTIALQDGAMNGITNVAFGGTDRKTLFGMMGNSVGKIVLNVPGPN